MDRSASGASLRTIVLALGSNLGARACHLARAREGIAALCGPPEQCSRIYETEPVGGPPGQSPFLNQVLVLRSARRAAEMLAPLLELETRLGRRREETWGPRVIDIDILLEDQSVEAGPRLILPHPRMHERPFVLVPLAEVMPEWRHPVLDLRVREMLERSGDGGVRVWREGECGRAGGRREGGCSGRSES
ncbi:MAG: 2-amino-4-hydroxy-6-hydroxymethyldihydropteridine diphosphokinase [Candidatus Eisenbacteria bacterium]